VRRAVVKKTKKPAKATKKAAKRTLPRPAPAAAASSSSPDTLLLIGGLALFILVLGDTIFLAFSARFLREAR
jgi:hypothetical protein